METRPLTTAELAAIEERSHKRILGPCKECNGDGHLEIHGATVTCQACEGSGANYNQEHWEATCAWNGPRVYTSRPAAYEGVTKLLADRPAYFKDEPVYCCHWYPDGNLEARPVRIRVYTD